MMKKIVALLLLFLSVCAYSQDNTIALVAVGDGASKAEAESNALRSAIREAYKTFVSADTKLLDDENFMNEAVKQTSDNIQSYEVVSSIELGTKWQVNVKAVISIDKLIEYVKARGSSTEFAGQTFAMQMKMRKLNKENEIFVLQNMTEQIIKLAAQMSFFNYEISQGQICLVEEGQYKLPVVIKATPNDNFSLFCNYIVNTLKSVALTKAEVTDYRNTNYPVFHIVPFRDIKNFNVPSVEYDLRSSEELMKQCESVVFLAILKNLYSFKISRIKSQGGDAAYYVQLGRMNGDIPFDIQLSENEIYETTGFSVVPDLSASRESKEMVDLGLSVKWASCNIGASMNNIYGKFFAWGDVTGQTWNGSSWSGGGFYNDPSYKTDSNANLTAAYDAARVNWGGSWRMPTKAEFEELKNNCTCTWTDNYKGTGVAGRIFTSKKSGYTDKSIFLPAAGGGDNGSLFDRGSYGCYWSATFGGCGAYELRFLPDRVSTLSYYRRIGRSVRPVSE